MCGIAGIVGLRPHMTVNRRRLRDMGDVIAHRGPDDEGMMLSDNVGFVHRRLSIIDIAGGHQPMTSPDGRVTIVYNGEIYNFRELRAALESRGHVFTTRSDTEVVLRAYEAFGQHCVEHLRGMFAFAIWDRRERTLTLARDRLGIKPLYYAVTDDALLFGSEIKAILSAGAMRPGLNRDIIPEYLAQRYVAGAETFFNGVLKLLPGRVLTWSAHEGVAVRRYWHLPGTVTESDLSLDEQAAEVRERLTETVRSHLVSDVPVGCFLSGGLDSSGLAALMSDMSDEPIRTFSVGFAERAYNELGYARMAAEAIGSRHHDVTVSARQFFDALPSLVWHEDEPIAFPSSVPLYFISRLAQDHVKVVMTGEGADELFLGYPRYPITAWNQRLGRLWRAVVPGGVRNLVGQAIPHLPARVRRYAQRTFLVPELNGVRGLCYENFAVFAEPLQRQLLASPALLAARDPYAEGMAGYHDAPAGLLERMAHADLQTYLVELLMKQDQMSMAASIESRVPFLDHRFVEYVAAMPARYKVHRWQTKAVLRKALRDVVPEAILKRPKMGFPVPVGDWMRGEFRSLVDDLVLGPRARARGLFAHEYVARIADEHQRGAWNHADRLWLLVNLELWQRIFIDGEAYADLRNAA